MTDTSVKYFDSGMSGAPVLSGSAGALLGVLDACLVDGFGSVTVASLVVASNIATATVSAGHGLAMVGNTGPVVRISGASPAGLNGDWRVTVTSSTQFVFATSGITDQTATGTISAKRAPAGFSKAYSGTNKAAYRADAEFSTRLFLRVDDAGTTSARVVGYESMTDVDTGSGPFPTGEQMSGGGYVYKSSAANATARPWRLYADEAAVYLFTDVSSNAAWGGGLMFGDGDSYLSPDAYACLLICSREATSAHRLYHLENTTGSWLARAYTQVGAAIQTARYSHGKTSTYLGDSGGNGYPAEAGNAVHLWPVEFWDSTACARGLMPGIWNPIHGANTPDALIVNSIPGLPGRDLMIQKMAYGYLALDLTGPWR